MLDVFVFDFCRFYVMPHVKWRHKRELTVPYLNLVDKPKECSKCFLSNRILCANVCKQRLCLAVERLEMRMLIKRLIRNFELTSAIDFHQLCVVERSKY